MARNYLKKATLTAQSDASNVHDIVRGILNDIEEGGDAKAIEYAQKFDKYDGNVILTQEEIAAACELVPQKLLEIMLLNFTLLILQKKKDFTK